MILDVLAGLALPFLCLSLVVFWLWLSVRENNRTLERARANLDASRDLAAIEAAIVFGWPDDVERSLYPTSGRDVQASPVRPPL